jgi:hypothetical protein
MGGALVLGGCGRETKATTSTADAGIHDAEGGERVVDQGAATTTCRSPGARAGATLQPVGTLADASLSDAGQAPPIVGTASFVATAGGVDLVVSITGCRALGYPVLLHQAADCSELGLRSPVWNASGGTNITSVHCTGTTGIGLDYYTRPNTDPMPWSVGGPASTSVLAHALVVHDPVTMDPLSCGVVQLLAASADAGPAVDAAVSSSVLAELSGLCTFRMLVGAVPDAGCASAAQVAACACEHCDLAGCLPACADYAACLQAQPDACASTCSGAPACADCLGGLTQCLEGFCVTALTCPAPITPGGPCARLEACCASQLDGGPACFAAVAQIEKYGGDPTCVGAMHDWDFLTNGPNDPPCNFDQ